MDKRTRTVVVQATLMILLILGFALLVVQLSGVFLLVFGAVVIAAMIRALAGPIQRLGLGETVSVLVSLLIILLVLGGTGWLFGSQIAQQLDVVAGRLPEGIKAVQSTLATLPFGDQIANMRPSGGDIGSRLMSWTTTAVGGLFNFIVVIIGAIYLALAPYDHVEGFARMFPQRSRDKVEEALNATGRALHQFLIGQLITMVIIGIFVTVGLWIVGVPAPIALGLICALLNFIPNFGAFIAAVPGVLLGFTVSPDTALYAVIVYVVAQQIEGNIITPIVQKRAVQLPPVLLIFGLLAFGVLFGTLGLLLGAPLTVVAYTLVMVLYSRDTLGDDVAVPGAAAEAKADA